MSILPNNLISDIKELLERYKQQTVSIHDINAKIPETLVNVLTIFENPDFSISNPEIPQERYLVIHNGKKYYCGETEIVKLREKNDVNMFLDMPRLTLTVRFHNYKNKFDFEKLPFPIQKILESGMSQPGEPLQPSKSWSRESLKSYICATRKLLADNKGRNIIKTSKSKILPKGSYYFNPRVNYIVIKNLQSTLNQP